MSAAADLTPAPTPARRLLGRMAGRDIHETNRVSTPLGRRQLSWPPGDNYLGRWGAGKFWCQLLRLLMLLVVSSEGLRAREASLA